MTLAPIEEHWQGSEPDTVAGLLRHHVRHRPDAVAYRFLTGPADSATYTFRQLDLRARTIAVHLTEAGLRGRPVLLLHPPGLEYIACFFGCLYAGAIAVPAYPPDTRRFGQSMQRLAAIARDARATHALTTKALADFAAAKREEIAALGLSALNWVASDLLDDARAETWRDPEATGGTLAFLQYTSGSTATPKGVMVSNGNLVSNLRSIHRRLRHDADSAMVSWLPPYHDMGLIGGILSPLYGGFPAHLMAPMTFVTRPLMWLQTLSETGASTSVAPNFGFEHCLRRVTPQQRDTLDLSAWRLALNGAEPVRADTLDRFVDYFGPCGFKRSALMPCYGLAEATLMASGVAAHEPPVVTSFCTEALGAGEARAAAPSGSPATRLVGCGEPVEDVGIAIVEAQTARRVPDSRIGEIWICGPNVARGYWRRPEATRETFRARIDGEPETEYLRTGDLGFIRDGQLHIVGRTKDVVIIQGRNHYPQDIELTVEQAATAVRPGCGAVFGVELDDTEQLVLAFEVESRPDDPAALLAAVRAAVLEQHEVTPHAVLLLKRATIPKTTSGKIQRQACKQRFLHLDLSVLAASVSRQSAAPSTSPSAGPAQGLSVADRRERVADAIAHVLSDVLGRELRRDELAGRRLAELGVDYPRLARAAQSLEERLDTRVDLGALLMDPRVETLTAQLLGESLTRDLGSLFVQPPQSVRTAAEIESWLIARAADRLGLPATALDPTRPLSALGIDSPTAVMILDELGQWLGRPLSPTAAFNHPTPRDLAAALSRPRDGRARDERARDNTRPRDNRPDGGRAFFRSTTGSGAAERGAEPIAIIGIGCRLPGAPDPQAFWQLLLDGRDAITEVPAQRWSAPRADLPQHGGFIDDIDRFDARFFGISAREAERMDPQQRLLLETAWHTLDDAAIAPTALAGTNTGVFVGISSHDYSELQMRDLDAVDIHSATGNAHSIAANRLSYLLDLHGPSIAVDTACSSSLAAIHLACQSLRAGECTVALAGGVNLLITPGLSAAFSRGRMLATDGRCRTFDDAATGYVRGEGVALVCLKPLSAALADGDRIYATVNGSHHSHGGRANGLTAPKSTAQRDVIERALDQAGLHADRIAYVEAHGTGTPLGDPIEWEALAQVYGRDDASCLVGSAKANIGHLEAAAGAAGLIKAALILHHGEVPPQIHFRTPNRHLAEHGSTLTVPVRRQPLARPSGGPACAAVSSFGFGGANVHVVLSTAPPSPPAAMPPTRGVHALCLSAHTPTALTTLAHRYRTHMAANPEIRLDELCHTANTGRAALSHRAVLVSDSIAALDDTLDALSRGEARPNLIKGEAAFHSGPPVAFLFSGQGSQYAGMGRSLYESFPQFADTIDRAERILKPLLDRSLLDLYFSPHGAEQLRRTRHCQPALVAFEIAIAQLWISLAVRPAAVLGHSIGALAAACVAGAMSFEDALTLAAERGRHMDAQPGDGAMIACAGPAGTIQSAAADFASVAIAAVNTDDQIVLSGLDTEINAVRDVLESRGVTVRPLAVSHAFHSKLMAGAAAPLRAAARRIGFTQPVITWVSDATGQAAGVVDADYWVEHMLGTVRFADGFRTLMRQGCTAFVEVGPHPTLLNLGRAITRTDAASDAATGGAPLWLPSLRRGSEDAEVLLRSLGQLHCVGATVDWGALDPAERRPRRVSLPRTVLEPQRYWFTASAQAAAGTSSAEFPQTAVPQAAIPHQVNGSAPALPRFTDSMRTATGRQMAAIATAPGYSAGRSGEALRQQVIGHISQVCGFPPDQIPPNARLGMDLGFDSLMKTDLQRRVTAGNLDLLDRIREALPDDPTVAQLIALLNNGRDLGDPVAPLVPPQQASAPVPTPTPMPTHSPEPAAPVQRERSFTDWAEYAELRGRLRQAESSGANPYGRIHDGFNAAVAVVEGHQMINFSAFNYLGLSHHPRVRKAALDAIERYGTSCSATPLLCGETPLHHELDSEIAAFLGTDAAIVFAGGHATNVATVGHLFGPQDLILHDAWIHDSSVRGSMLSGARRRPFPHNDWQALDRILGTLRDQHRRAVVLIEGAYSQDGDLPDLPRFIEVKQRHDAMLMIDEAHSIGVLGRTGRGVGEHFGVPRDQVDLWMGTLSKALGSLGGYIAANEQIIRYLKFTTPLYIFSTGISPANAAAALEALRVIQDEPHRVANVQRLAEYFRTAARDRGMDIGVSRASAVVPIILGDWERAMAISNTLHTAGVNVMPIGYPAVDRDKCRLRFFINTDHTEADLDHSLDLLGQAMDEYSADERPTQPSSPRTGNGIGTGTGTGTGRDGTASAQAVPEVRTERGNGARGSAEVLVAGASGFIGGHLVRRLADHGYRVRALVRRRSDHTALAGLPIELATGSLDDPESLRRAAEGVRYVYNCTGKSADWGPWEEFRSVNVDGCVNLVNAAAQAGTVERFLHLSTTDVYGYPVIPCDESTEPRDIGLPYNRSKVMGERAVREAAARAGLPLTIVRPVSVYGPRSKDFVIEIANLLLKKQMVYIGGGRVPAGLLYVGNAADAIIAACTSPDTIGRAYNLRDAELTTWREYIEALARGIGAKAPSVNLPGPLATGVATVSEKVYGALRISARPVLTRHAVRLLDRYQSYPIDRAREDFGFKSETSFEEGMRLTLAWLDSAEGRRHVAR
ncbi:MAG TPA: aminotransferase class I/II-fold pyridoxal phosphate-dependent enzyme [Actinocrinis sp.]|uniref:aminotransferase class I/II-fold pyridoxal phosphate-dependent enzyme n=1 Tax=Actinocrinis sp. TaxID=1920516 RepID=UPI002D295DAC|nr:aminotransferase class I/II-fold pyridoxal phosphate-dependent enzyme [Actinocrinis sp.]HZU57903.1 aminotransferase class I/II-fold pyridoxal phosphate-dependent enzyme [Actinocrinis sp.]